VDVRWKTHEMKGFAELHSGKGWLRHPNARRYRASHPRKTNCTDGMAYLAVFAPRRKGVKGNTTNGQGTENLKVDDALQYAPGSKRRREDKKKVLKETSRRAEKNL